MRSSAASRPGSAGGGEPLELGRAEAEAAGRDRVVAADQGIVERRGIAALDAAEVALAVEAAVVDVPVVDEVHEPRVLRQLLELRGDPVAGDAALLEALRLPAVLLDVALRHLPAAAGLARERLERRAVAGVEERVVLVER